MPKPQSEPMLGRLSACYRRTLLEDVMPFWMHHGFDEKYGGISNILDDGGNALSHDKYLWSQGRALWTFSALYNRVEKREEWLRFAHHIYQYVTTHGRDERGYWMYRLDKEGNVLDRDISIAVDGFVMSGLAEYFVATNNGDALQLALATQQTIAARLATPGSYGLAPYPLPAGMKNLGVAMLYSLYFFDLGQIAGRDDLAQQGLKLAHEVLNDFYVPQKDALLEFVSCSGEFVESPEGRTCIPGHGLEALWFLISIFERTGDKERIVRCCRLIRRHLELAWDEEFGGLQLAIDIDGRKPVHWQKPECKPWWVQVEALVATAYAYRHSGDPWCLEWHEKVSRWAYAHYPVPTGEWTQWLDRQGNKTQSAALPLKDPFHLPRALMCLIDVFGDIG